MAYIFYYILQINATQVQYQRSIILHSIPALLNAFEMEAAVPQPLNIGLKSLYISTFLIHPFKQLSNPFFNPNMFFKWIKSLQNQINLSPCLVLSTQAPKQLD